MVCSYFLLSADLFLNVSARDAKGLEWAGNLLLTPTQYLLAGREAIPREDGSWEFVQRFDYGQAFWIKTASSVIALPPSLILGSLVKGLSFLDRETQSRFHSLKQTRLQSHEKIYQDLGIREEAERQDSLGHVRRPGDEQVLQIEKKALADITHLLNQSKIPWWVDCGTCLGAYRYGGAIPWDQDVDIAVLQIDFENVLHVLNQLDRKKYLVQDWSSRDHPKSFIKVFIRESGTMIDIYHFAIAAEQRELHYIFSLESHLFFPEWFKIRERRFKAPVAFETVFPLKKMDFDGVEIFVPRDTKKYLQRCYGEDLAPAKIYDPITGLYEKDLSHPYWQRVYAH